MRSLFVWQLFGRSWLSQGGGGGGRCGASGSDEMPELVVQAGSKAAAVFGKCSAVRVLAEAAESGAKAVQQQESERWGTKRRTLQLVGRLLTFLFY